MRSPLLKLHEAIYNRLKDNLSYSVYDDVPENADFPYVSMGAVTSSDWSDKFIPGMQVISTIDLWSQYKGRKEVLEMTGAALQVLTSGDIDLSPEFKAVWKGLDSLEIIIDIDGVTRHGILKYKLLIEEL